MMKGEHYIIITCDHCNRKETYTSPSRQGCISHARRLGWEFRMTEDVCGGCAKEEPP